MQVNGRACSSGYNGKALKIPYFKAGYEPDGIKKMILLINHLLYTANDFQGHEVYRKLCS